jgi:hypothetical protein
VRFCRNASQDGAAVPTASDPSRGRATENLVACCRSEPEADRNPVAQKRCPYRQLKVRLDVHIASASGAGRIRDNLRQTQPRRGRMASRAGRSISASRFTVNNI